MKNPQLDEKNLKKNTMGDRSSYRTSKALNNMKGDIVKYQKEFEEQCNFPESRLTVKENKIGYVNVVVRRAYEAFEVEEERDAPDDGPKSVAETLTDLLLKGQNKEGLI